VKGNIGMRINISTQSLNAEFCKTNNIQKTRKNNNSSKILYPDRSEISHKAQDLNKTQTLTEIISTNLSAQPDFRIEKVNETKQKIQNGYYDSEEFLNKLADKLLKGLGTI